MNKTNGQTKMTAEVAMSMLSYDTESGILRWRESNGKRVKKGDEAGYRQKKRNTYYREVEVNKQSYLVHRVIVLLMTGSWPDGCVDHIDGDGLNNKWENLRVVNVSENGKNQSRHSRNSSGVTGVAWHTRFNRWYARIFSDGVQYNLGYFDSKEAAIEARKDAEAKYGFHRNHGREKLLTR